jgi:hypothetical protein
VKVALVVVTIFVQFVLPTVEVKNKVPACNRLSQHGETEMECLAHHYKFVLVLEKSQEDDFVTEQLYQVTGLKGFAATFSEVCLPSGHLLRCQC